MILFPTLLLFHLLGINGQDSEACLAPTKYLQMKIDPLTEHSGLTVEGVYAYKVGRKTLYKPFRSSVSTVIEFPQGAAGYLLLHTKAGSGVITLQHNLYERNQQETYYLFEDDLLNLMFTPSGARVSVGSWSKQEERVIQMLPRLHAQMPAALSVHTLRSPNPEK
jgi:hypothetical protein